MQHYQNAALALRSALMVERGLGEYTTHSEWVDSRGIVRVKHGGYVGPSYKSLRSFDATPSVEHQLRAMTALTDVTVNATCTKEPSRSDEAM